MLLITGISLMTICFEVLRAIRPDAENWYFVVGEGLGSVAAGVAKGFDFHWRDYETQEASTIRKRTEPSDSRFVHTSRAH